MHERTKIQRFFDWFISDKNGNIGGSRWENWAVLLLPFGVLAGFGLMLMMSGCTMERMQACRQMCPVGVESYDDTKQECKCLRPVEVVK